MLGDQGDVEDWPAAALSQRLLHRQAGGVVDMDDAAMAVPAFAGEMKAARPRPRC